MIVCVGEPLHDLTGWGPVRVSSPVHIPGRRRQGIKEAMGQALQSAALGDVVCQNDIRFTDDPFAAPPTPGRVRCLNTPVSHRHCCPQAFIIYDEPTRLAVLDAWLGKGRACTAWRDVPKICDRVVAIHDRPCTIPVGNEGGCDAVDNP